MALAQSLGTLFGLCIFGMWLALESDRGPMAGALIVIASGCTTVWLLSKTFG